MSEALELETPLLLVAMPQVLDPFFRRAVVLLVHHRSEGSLGFIVNRPTGVKLSEILEGLEIEWEGGDDALAHFGGPVQPQLGTLIYRRPEDTLEESFPITEEISMSQNLADLEALVRNPPEAFRFLLGYAGWGDGQLADEFLRNDWITAPASVDLVFAEPEEIWALALASVGVDPLQLPSVASGGGDEAN